MLVLGCLLDALQTYYFIVLRNRLLNIVQDGPGQHAQMHYFVDYLLGDEYWEGNCRFSILQKWIGYRFCLLPQPFML